MAKDELITKVKELGYNAAMIDGIPYILDVTYDKAQEIVKSLDYNSTYGVRSSNFKANIAET